MTETIHDGSELSEISTRRIKRTKTIVLLFLLIWMLFPAIFCMAIYSLTNPASSLSGLVPVAFSKSFLAFWCASYVIIILGPKMILAMLNFFNSSSCIKVSSMTGFPLRRLGVCTSITIGIPALAFAYFALLPNHKDFPYHWESTPSSVQLINSQETESLNAYVFILDISKTFRVTKGNYKSDDCTKLRDLYNDCLLVIDSIYDYQFEKSIFHKDLLEEKDDKFIFLMCEQLYHVVKSSGNGQNSFIEIVYTGKMNDFCNTLTATLNKESNGDKAKRSDNRTNFLKCLKKVLAYFEKRPPNSQPYSHINLIIFSDFIHDPSKSNHFDRNGELSNIVELMDEIEHSGYMSITAFFDDEFLNGREEKLQGNEIAFLPFFNRLSPENYETINLDTFNGLSATAKLATMQKALYPKRFVSDPIYLRHDVSAIIQSSTANATLKIPDDFFGEVWAELENPDCTTKDVVVQVKDEKGVVLSLANKNRTHAIGTFEVSKGEEINIALKRYYDANRFAKLKMRLSFPKQRATYEIPLTIMPKYPEKMKSLMMALMALIGLAPICIGMVMWSRICVWFEILKRKQIECEKRH